LHGSHFVQVVDDAAGDQGDGAAGVFDFFAHAVAHGVQRVADAVAAVVCGGCQALGGVVLVATLWPLGWAALASGRWACRCRW
jgi:hypothetical protein